MQMDIYHSRTTNTNIVTYACVVWVNALKLQTNILRFERVQRRGLELTIISGAFPRTPLINISIMINHITGIPDIRIRGEAAKADARLKAYGNWTVERVPSVKLPDAGPSLREAAKRPSEVG